MPRRLNRDRILDAVHAQIISRQIPAGAAIDEVEIADQMMVSRTPIREVVHLLCGKGLLVYENSVGFRTPVFGMYEISNHFQVVEEIYPLVFAHAGEMRRSENVEALRAALDRIRTSTKRRETVERKKAYRAFMMSVAAATQNRIYMNLMETLIDQHIMIRSDFMKVVSTDEHDRQLELNLQIYSQIRDLLEQGDAEGLRKAALDRIEASRQFIFKHLSAMPPVHALNATRYVEDGAARH